MHDMTYVEHYIYWFLKCISHCILRKRNRLQLIVRHIHLLIIIRNCLTIVCKSKPYKILHYSYAVINILAYSLYDMHICII